MSKLEWAQISLIKQRVLRHRVVNPDTGCWESASTFWSYPQTRIGGKYVGFHHAALWAWQGKRTKGRLEVPRHTCDNARCFNPGHLCTGSQVENVKDSLDRGRRPRRGQQRYCGKGHAMTSENTYLYREHQRCRACHAASSRKDRLKKRTSHALAKGMLG